MKFAKELEDDLVPEWRVKYFDYKTGKKKIKAVSRALRNINRTPKTPARPGPKATQSSDALPFTSYDFSRRTARRDGGGRGQSGPGDASIISIGANSSTGQDGRRTVFTQSPPMVIPDRQSKSLPPADPSSATDAERRPLQDNEDTADWPAPRRYGSFVATPPDNEVPGQLTRLELPDPALDPSRSRALTLRGDQSLYKNVSKPAVSSPDAYYAGPHTPNTSHFSNFRKRMFQKQHADKKPHGDPRERLRRAFTSHTLEASSSDIHLEAYRELDARQDEFYGFLDKELSKIEKFYQAKEDEATRRLDIIRQQLHEMRDRRLQELQNLRRQTLDADEGIFDGSIKPLLSDLKHENQLASGHRASIITSARKILTHRPGDTIGKTTKAMEQLGSPSSLNPKAKQERDKKDYVRKADSDNVPYIKAKRRLKLALQEFYRGLELLKSYALLNRTAFRKINKKYDKAVNARPTLQYMAEKVNIAHFVQSSVIEGHLVAVEDLYARYFERGNRKIAVNKLRSKMMQGDHSGATFRNGMYIAGGIGFAIAGLVNGVAFLFGDNPTTRIQTSYLLQLYGGYFLAVLLMILFVLDCRVWNKARINYVFVFEYDTRHVLDWRQLAELPCFLTLLLGIFIWLNFEFEEAHPMFLYWPVVLIGLSIILVFAPVRTLYWRSRKWFAYSNWRILLAGLYPVEFRDFFLGDMYCSETYTMSQIELFFCLYAHNWRDPPQCNSNHSMLLGFFTALPAVWRALQCLRRYYDSRNWFPHLANFGKYMCNVIYYMTLSLYRLQISHDRRAAFITFAAINAVYCSFWDVFMDWSLGNWWSRNWLLRDNLAYRHRSVYYIAIILDVVLRQQWIFYAVFTHDLQHSSIVSFCVGLAEVLRRGMWSLFRVENEHINNVKIHRASRDIPLPYHLSDESQASLLKNSPSDDRDSDQYDGQIGSPTNPAAGGSGIGTAVDLERTGTRESQATSSLRRRKYGAPSSPAIGALQRVGTIIANAHGQDYQKRKRTEIVGENGDEGRDGASSDEDEDDTDHQHSSDSDVQEASRPAESGSSPNRPSATALDDVTQRGAEASQYLRAAAQDTADDDERDLSEVRDTVNRARSPV